MWNIFKVNNKDTRTTPLALIFHTLFYCFCCQLWTCNCRLVFVHILLKKSFKEKFMQFMFLCCLIGTNALFKGNLSNKWIFSNRCKYILKMFYLLVHQVHIEYSVWWYADAIVLHMCSILKIDTCFIITCFFILYFPQVTYCKWPIKRPVLGGKFY